MSRDLTYRRPCCTYLVRWTTVREASTHLATRAAAKCTDRVSSHQSSPREKMMTARSCSHLSVQWVPAVVETSLTIMKSGHASSSQESPSHAITRIQWETYPQGTCTSHCKSYLSVPSRMAKTHTALSLRWATELYRKIIAVHYLIKHA